MKNIKTVKYSSIGEVAYRKSARARNLSIRINSGGAVSVTIPWGCSFNRAEHFVFQKEQWIIEKLSTIKRKNEANLAWKVGDYLSLGTSGIIFLSSGGKDLRWEEDSEGYKVYLPDNRAIARSAETDMVKELVAVIGLIEAKRQLPAIMNECVRTTGLSYNKLTIRRMRSRWGSCSSKDNISLSSGLIFLPEPLIRYVCIHELAHTLYKDHSHRFWTCLEGMLPEAKAFRKDIRNRAIIA